MKIKLNIRNKFLIPTVALVIVGMGFSSTISYLKSKTALNRSLLDNIEQRTESTATMLETWLKDRKLDLSIWSHEDAYSKATQDTFVGRAARISANEKFAKLKRDCGYYEDIALADLGGTVIASSTEAVIGKINIVDRDYFRAAIAGNTSVSEANLSRASGNPIFAIAAPIKYDGQIQGVLFGLVNINSFSAKFVDSIKVGENGYAFIFDRRGIVLADPDKSKVMKMDLNQFDFGKRLIEQRSGLLEYENNGAVQWAFLKKLDELGWTVAINVPEEEVIKPIVSLGRINMMVTLIVLVVASIVIYLITSTVVKPLNRVVAGLKDAAEGEGDLTKRIDISSNDEVRELAHWFNVFVEKLQGIITQIAGGVDTLSSASTELSSISDQMSKGIQNVSIKTENLSTSAEEMSSNASNVAAAMEQSATNTNMVASAAEEMSSTIDEIARNAEKARGISDKAAQKTATASSNMSQLGSAAKDIDVVVETITDISEQVNLLALNATIEAARAGEAGKGFAVVANEIKELARQTAAATQDIKSKIGAIQGTTAITVNEITEITRVISDVNQLVASIAASVEEQSSATKEIAANVTQTSSGIQSVNQSINKSSAAASEISKDISVVSVTMSEMSNSSSQVNMSAQELSKLSEMLKSMVNQFKI